MDDDSNWEQAAVAEAARIIGLSSKLNDVDEKTLSLMGLAGRAYWLPSQIAGSLRLSVIQVRSRLRALEKAGYVERSSSTGRGETESRLTVKGWFDGVLA